MAGFRGAQFGISQPPPGSQQVGQALAGQQQQAMPMQGQSMLPTLGMQPLMDTGMHSQASTDAAMQEADRRLQGAPERLAHSTRSPMIAWQLATLGIPKLELDLDALSSGQAADEEDVY